MSKSDGKTLSVHCKLNFITVKGYLCHPPAISTVLPIKALKVGYPLESFFGRIIFLKAKKTLLSKDLSIAYLDNL